MHAGYTLTDHLHIPLLPRAHRRVWFPLGVVGTLGCAAALARLSNVVRAKHVHEETLRLLRESLPSIAIEAEEEELRVAGRVGAPHRG